MQDAVDRARVSDEGSGAGWGVDEVVERLCRATARALGAPAVALTTLHGDSEVIAAGTGLRSPLATGQELRITRTLLGDTDGADLRPVVVEDTRQTSTQAFSPLAESGVSALLAIPLISAAGEATGALLALDYKPRAWSEQERAIVADLAIAIGRWNERRREAIPVQAALKAPEPHVAPIGALFQDIIERPLVGIFTVDEGSIGYANPMLLEMLGYTLEEMRSVELAHVLTPQDYECVERQLRDQPGAPAQLRFCTSLRRKDGGTAYVEVHVGRLQIESRTVVAGAVLEISEMVRERAELNDREARLQRVFDDNLAGAVIAGPGGRIVACNREFARVAGFASPESALGIELSALEKKPGGFARLLERLQTAGGAVCEEIEFVRRDGAEARVLAKLSTTLDAENHPLEIRANVIDVTQRSRAEDALRRSDERLRMVELATNDVLWDCDVATGTVTWSGAAAKLFRYRTRDLDRSFHWHIEHIHADDRERVVRGLDRLISGADDTWSDEYRFLRGDHSYATVFDRAYVVRNGRHEPIRIIGWMLDVTERKRAENAHRLLANASSILESTLDVDATVRSFARLCVPTLADACVIDLVEEDGTLRRAAAAGAAPATDNTFSRNIGASSAADALTSPALEAVRTGEPVFVPEAKSKGSDPTRRVQPDLADGPQAWVALPLTARGRTLGAATLAMVGATRRFTPMDLMMAHELAYRAALALDNARLYQTAQSAIETRDEVLRVISHDLREPLNTIVASLALLATTVRERREDARRWLSAIQRSADQMNALIGDLLDATNMEAKRFLVTTARQGAGSFLSEACDLLRPLAEARDIAFDCQVEEDLPVVSIDSKQLLRVLSNLVGNATKFTPVGGKIRITGARVQGELRVSVQDTGPGIPRGKLERVFERFWQAAFADRRGAGLGLTIAKGIIEAHGGRIWVESTEGKGSTFYFTLPEAKPAGDEPVASAAERASRQPGDEATPASQPAIAAGDEAVPYSGPVLESPGDNRVKEDIP
jgi:PAS domain S-box-containing protein